MAWGDRSDATAARSWSKRRRGWVAASSLGVLLAAVLGGLFRVEVRTLHGSASELLVLASAWLALVGAAGLIAWAAGGTRARRCGRAALALLPALFVALACEAPVLLGGLDWRTLLPPTADDVFIQLRRSGNPWAIDDPELLFTRTPGMRVRGETFGDCVGWLGAPADHVYPYDVQYDARGYRNERSLAHAEIAVVGDSFVEAALVATPDLFTTQLAKQRGVEVANLGVGGYGPQQELAVLRRHALPLDPVLVYWFFFEGNDLTDAARYDAERRELERRAQRQSGRLLRSWHHSVLSRAAAFVASSRASARKRALQQSGRLTVAGPDHGRTIYFPYPARPLDDGQLAALATVEATLAAAAAACRASDSELVLVFVPEKFRVYGDRCELAAGSVAASWRCSDLPERVAEMAQRRSIELLDLTPSLRAAAAAGPLLYFADDGHWNDVAHRHVGELLTHDAARRLSHVAER